MIRIIEPEEYKLISTKTRSRLQMPNHQSQSQGQSDEDMEVEIVDTEEKGNAVVYRLSNIILVLVVASIFIAYFIESGKPVIIKIDGTEYIEVPTAYQANNGGTMSQVTMLMPYQNSYDEEQTEIVAQMCLKHQISGCSYQLMLTRGVMFIEVEKWLNQYERSATGQVLVFWEERLALSILMLALKNYRVDVVAQQEDSRLYLSLRINLRDYGVGDRVRFTRTDMLAYNFRQYGLVVCSHRIFDDYIYPELLQQAVREGAVELINNLLYDFLKHTHLVLLYGTVKDESRKHLEDIHHQVTAVVVDESSNEVREEKVNNFADVHVVVILDDRMKDISQFKATTDQADDGYDIISASKQAQREEHSAAIVLTNVQPLKVIRRILPSGIIGFFQCASSKQASAQPGQFYDSQFASIKLMKQQSPPQSIPTYNYNFVLHFLLGFEECNVLSTSPDEILANLITMTSRGQFFIPARLNYNAMALKESLIQNERTFRIIDDPLDERNLQDFIYENQIGLAFITLHDFATMFNELIAGLNMHMNIIMQVQDSPRQAELVQSLLGKFYVYVVVRGPSQFDLSCTLNFDVEYYEDRRYPNNSFLLISKSNIVFEDVNPHIYYIAPFQRQISSKKHQCLQNFTTIDSELKFNLKKGSKTLVIDSKIWLFLDSSVQIDTAISEVKSEEGMAQFFWDNLLVSDKIAIFGQHILSQFLLINLLWKIANNGEAIFVNGKESDEAQIEKLLKLNSVMAAYDFAQVDLYSSSQFQAFLAQRRSSVLIMTAEQFIIAHKQLEKTKSILVLVNYGYYDEDVQHILFISFPTQKKMLLHSVQSKPTKYNVCRNYKVSDLSGSQESIEGLDETSWMVLIL